MRGFWAIFSPCCHVWGMFSAVRSGKLHFLCAWHSVILIPCRRKWSARFHRTELLRDAAQRMMHAHTIRRSHFLCRLFLPLDLFSSPPCGWSVLPPSLYRSQCQFNPLCRLSFYLPFFLILSSFLCVQDYHESSDLKVAKGIRGRLYPLQAHW